jgi:type IV pilus biogenesis/stability protein PilW
LEKQEAGSFYPVTEYGLLPRVAQVLSSLAFYPWKTVVPTGLSPLYPVHPFAGLWNLPLLLSVAFVVCLTVGLFLARHRWPALLAAWLFYTLLILPLSGIVAFGPYRAADRFSYVPSLGWAILAGAGLFYCWRLWSEGRLPSRVLVLAQSFALLLLIALGTLTWRQTQIWRDSERLWRHALAVDERSSFAHNNLGVVLAERGEIAAAMREFRRALEIDPVHVRSRTNLAHFLARQGAVEEAIGHLHLVLKIEPTHADAHNNLGNILADRGESDEAIARFRKALELNPELAVTHYNLARVLAKKGNLEEALSHYRKALEINPEDPDIHNNMGLLLVTQGSLNEGIEQFRQALRVSPGYAKAYFNLGKVSAQQNRLDEAVQYFQQALQIEPEVAEIHENLARVLARQGRTKEAVEEYQEALRILRSRTRDGVQNR